MMSCFMMISMNNEVDATSLKLTSFTASRTTGYVGNSIKLTASASGGKSTKKYKFYYKYNGKTYTIKSYSTSKTATFKPTKKGTYTVYVTVKSGSTTKTKSKKITIYSKLTGSISLSSNYINKNNTITITAASSGGKGTKKYRYYYTLNGSTYSIKSYSSSTSVTFTPTVKGTYKIYVKIRDGNNRYKTVAKYLYVCDSTLKVTATASDSSPSLADTITLTATGSGGHGTLKYKFSQIENGSETILQSYSKTKTCKFTIDNVNTTYTFKIYVQDVHGKTSSTKITVTSDSENIITTSDMTLYTGQLYSPSYTVINDDISVSIKSVSSRKIVNFDKYNHLMPCNAGTTTVTLKVTYGDYSGTATLKVTVVESKNVLVGCDISKYQSDVSISTLKNTFGMDYVIMRVGYGTSQDTMFESFVSQCQSAGMPYGVYIYTTATSTSKAKKEAQFVLEALEENGIFEDENFIGKIFYDMEYSSLGSLGTSTINSIFKQFKSTIDAEGYDVEVGIYANTSWVKSKLTGSNCKAAYLWQAHYSRTLYTKVYKDPGMWQTGSTFKVTNKSGSYVYIDMDYWYTDR